VTDLSSLSDAELQSLQAQIVQTGAAGIQRNVVQPTPGISYRREYDPESPEFQEKYGPVSGMGDAATTGLGFQRGVHQVGRQIGNILGLESNEDLAEAEKYDKPLMSTGGGRLGSLLGETVPLAPLSSLAGPRLLAQALVGAGQGGLMAGPGNRLGGAVGGATAGALGPALGGVARKATYGVNATPAARELIEAGVPLTPGQMNPSGIMNQLEQSAESIPGAKQVIEPARESAERSYQALIMQRASAPGAPPIKPSENISDMLQQAQDSYAPLYAQAHGYPVKTSSLAGDFRAASQAPGVPKSLQQSEYEWLKDRLTQLPKNPQSEDLLQLRSDIRSRMRNANLKTDTDSGHVANINSRAEQAVTSSLNSQLPPDALATLKSADANYGNYKIVENAVASSKDNLAGLTPQKLSQAVFNATADPAYARGAGGPLRDLAKTGTEVFQNVSPPTGQRVGSLGLAAFLAMTHPRLAVPLAAGGLGLTGSNVGRRLAAGITMPQQGAQALGEALSKFSPPGTKGAAQTAFNLGAGPSLQDVPPAVLARAMASMKKSEKQEALVPQFREGSQ
jgi:hypothetical protein